MRALILLCVLVSMGGPAGAAEPSIQDEVVSSGGVDTPDVATSPPPSEVSPADAPSGDAHDLAGAIINSRGLCLNCDDDVDLVALLKAEGSRLSDDENVVASTIAKLEFLQSRPRIATNSALQAAIDSDCFGHWVKDKRLLVRRAFMRLGDLVAVDVESAFRVPVTSTEQVFGIPLNATLSRQACSSDPVIDDCSLREHFSSFPLRPGETKLPWLFGCTGPRGDALYATTDGQLVMATFDPFTHQLDDEAALTSMKRAYGKPALRFNYQLLYGSMSVWSIKLSRGGIFFQTTKNRPSAPATAFEYRDVDALVATVRRQRADQKEAERQRAQALIE